MSSSLPLLDFKASDLLREQERKRDLRKENYQKQLRKCMQKIHDRHVHCQMNEMVFAVPLELTDDPNYDVAECTAELKKVLRSKDFYVKATSGRKRVDGKQVKQPELMISWKIDDVAKMRTRNERNGEAGKRKQGTKLEGTSEENQAALHEEVNSLPLSQIKIKEEEVTPAPEPIEETIHFDPDSGLSQLSVRTALMRSNSRYAHLPAFKGKKINR